MARAASSVGAGALIVSVSKGLDPERLTTLSCVLGDVLAPGTAIAVLSGPSFAREVYDRQPTAVVAASRDPAAVQRVQHVFATGHFRVYTSSDVLGVELGGALMNVIDVGAGMLVGLGGGHEQGAFLVTRGLASTRR